MRKVSACIRPAPPSRTRRTFAIGLLYLHPLELKGSTAVLRGSSSDASTTPMIPPINVLAHSPVSSGSPGTMIPNTWLTL